MVSGLRFCKNHSYAFGKNSTGTQVSNDPIGCGPIGSIFNPVVSLWSNYRYNTIVFNLLSVQSVKCRICFNQTYVLALDSQGHNGSAAEQQ